MAQTPGRHRAGPAPSAGGSDKRVELKAEARGGACECLAANEGAEHVVVALLSSVDL